MPSDAPQPGPSTVLDAHRTTLSDLTESGADTGEQQPARELLNYSTGMREPRARLISSSGTVLRPTGSVARFIWLIAGNDRLEDIAFYEKRVRSYTDSGLTVPGSSYGKRIFDPRPGLNQIDGVVKELRRRPDSRRAAAVVWTPEDAVRASNDIPCTFGLFFHIRGGNLHTTTVMRSNNALTLLPYNFFEFSMLGELVAAELAVPLGTYTHWAASMHIFPGQRNGDTGPTAGEQVRELLADTSRAAVTMPAMPTGDALGQANRLAQLEAALRHAPTSTALDEIADRARQDLQPYWADLFAVLHAYVLAKHDRQADALVVAAALPEHFRSGVEAELQPSASAAAVRSGGDALFELPEPAPTRAEKTGAAALSGPSTLKELARQLERLGVDPAPTVSELLDVDDALTRRRGDYSVAARDAAAGARAATGADRVSDEEARQELDRVRQRSR